MTLRTNARAAGVAFLVYIGAGLTLMTENPSGLTRIVLELVADCCALVLAVTLYAITRDVDREVAMLGMTFRVGEGLLGAMGLAVKVSTMLVGATLFAIGSTLFCWLLLRGRLIPRVLAWLGVFASVLLVAALPVQMAGMLPNVIAQGMWLPMLGFEVPFAIWLIVKAPSEPTSQEARHRL
jgi:hypothetical protein